MNVLVFFSSLAGYQSDNTMQPTMPQNDTALFSPRGFWNEMRISAFTLDRKQLFKQSGSKMFFRIFSLVRRCACGCSGRVHSLEKIVKIFFFFCQQAVNHFPLKHKSGAARANDLMYPDRISFFPPAFLSLPFHCGSLKKGSKWRLTLPQVAATAPRSSPPCCTCVTLARILSLVCTVLLYSPPGTHFCEKVLNKTFRRNNGLLLSLAYFFLLCSLHWLLLWALCIIAG